MSCQYTCQLEAGEELITPARWGPGMCPHWTICRLQHVWASKILDGRRHQGNGERGPRRARPGCSTTALAAPDRRVIESQSVRLSAKARSHRHS
jgi:hypothetical protein